MKTDEIRKGFLDFFRSKGHEVVPSDSLVPKGDPTLLFTGAGMNQFKEKFLGRNITYRRAASCQKCLRTADLENVGKTSGHHTFFEMLGNFSFEDYFKKEAILWALEFLTENLKLKSKDLWVSVYKDDEEAFRIWKDIVKVPMAKILKFGEKENFWPSEAPTKGPNGPCGPCSEVFYDLGKRVGCGKPDCTPACDCGRFVEVWNLVFTQFDRQSDGTLKPLPNKNIDTGMGLERLASVMQDVRTNFEIDIFRPIVAEVEKMSMVHGPWSMDNRWEKLAKANAIADHIRAVTFAISDGLMPSNEERGYVVRKLIRRSMKHAMDLNVEPPFLYKLVSGVANVMKAAYPEVRERRDDIAQIVKREEENFLFVIESQLPRVEGAFRGFKNKSDKEALAELAFNFYDTYGMPYDMLEETSERFNLKIDKNLFESRLDKQRQLSRSKSKISSEIFSETFEKKVEALGLKTEFLGYEKAHSEANVLAVLDHGEVILDRTPFYGESGGQVGDWGRIETKSGTMEVEDAKRIGEAIVHIGKMTRGHILKGEAAKVNIDEETRRKVMRNHTATHLLQAALREALGEHVRQTGSLVDAQRLRFDFTHMKKLEERELARVEEIVNENIKKGISVKKEIKTLESAKEEGAIALFDEKYSEKVRVVSISDISKELCGGTHVDNTKEIGSFKIVSENSVAAGVRRIEAMTDEAARKWIEEEVKLKTLKLKAQSEKEEAKKARGVRLKLELSRIDDYISKVKDVGGVKIVSEVVSDADMDILRILSDEIKIKGKASVVILSSKGKERVSFVVAVANDLVKKRGLNAGELAEGLAKSLGGSSGGRPDFAQGGGRDESKLEAAMEKIIAKIKGKLS